MKKLLSLLFIHFIALSLVLAGGTAKTKQSNSCSPDYKYKAHARATCVGLSTIQDNWNCFGAFSTASRTMSGSVAAWQTTDNSASGVFFNGQVLRPTWCSRGENISDFLINHNELLAESEGLEEAAVKVGAISFDNETQTIKIPNINGYIKDSFTDFKSHFKIIIWKTDGDDDTEITPDKIKWEASAEYLNGTLSLENFGANEVTLSQNGEEYVMTFDNFSKTLTFNEDIRDFEVHIECEGNPETTTLMGRLAAETSALESNKDVTISVFPNPATEYLTVKFNTKNGNNEDNNYTLSLYDVTGKIYKQEHNAISGDNSNYTIDISTIPNGTYYLAITSGRKIYVKHFIK